MYKIANLYACTYKYLTSVLEYKTIIRTDTALYTFNCVTVPGGILVVDL